jgi:hypothetical protein
VLVVITAMGNTVMLSVILFIFVLSAHTENEIIWMILCVIMLIFFIAKSLK